MAKQRTAMFDEFFAPHISGIATVHERARRVIDAMLQSKSIVIVSAVCPDYERLDGRFTYRALGEGVPYITGEHLRLVERLLSNLPRDMKVQYLVSLADTEFDLPLVVDQLAGGSQEEFFRRCEASCVQIVEEAHGLKLPLQFARRFTDHFPNWFEVYQQALQVVRLEIESNDSTRQDAELKSVQRSPLYSAMAGKIVGRDYAYQMVLRQWAQYMTWGKLARDMWGDFVMINHSTPNLTRVNHPSFRALNQRPTPIVELNIGTMPT